MKMPSANNVSYVSVNYVFAAINLKYPSLIFLSDVSRPPPPQKKQKGESYFIADKKMLNTFFKNSVDL